VAWAIQLPVGVQGSPVIGMSNQQPLVFVEDDNNLVALNGFTGQTVWTSVASTGPVRSAPMVVQGATGDLVVVGANSLGTNPGNLLALDGNTGATVGSFLAQETYTTPNAVISNGLGPVKSSPTLLSQQAGLPINAVVVGTDAAQGPGPSQGHVYAVAPNGQVLWETLLAGHIGGCPAVAGPSTLDQQHGAVYVATTANTWGGSAGIDGSSQGRLYKLDAKTGQVLAEVFLNGDATGSPLFLQSQVQGDQDPNGANARVFVTAHNGQVLCVSPAPSGPAGAFESPGLTVVWNFSGTFAPTSPALDAASPPTSIYVGDQSGLRALSITNGTSLWYQTVDPNGNSLGHIVGAPAVVIDQTTLQSQIIFGNDNATAKVLAYLDLPAILPSK
jgi:outer membrane protein assembly factor BamB